MRYNAQREYSLDGSALVAGQNVADVTPRPSQSARAREEWEQLLERLNETETQVLHLLLEGVTQEEIGERLGLTARHVRRLIKIIEARSAADTGGN